jgi:hypothetical protein
MSTAHRTDISNGLSGGHIGGYLAAVAAIVVLWASAYGLTFTSYSRPPAEPHHCAGIGDSAARLACYDDENRMAQRLPGRGYAPIAR